MLRLLGPGTRLCDGRSRRELLRIGGLGVLGSGLNLTDLIGAAIPSAGPLTADATFGRAKSCILLFLMGGPPQHSTWDPKPDAPAEVRGEFGPISTKSPGLSICELMPKTAAVADKVCVLRAVSTADNAHSSSGYYMLTGRPHQPMNFENANPGPPNDAPSLGAMLGRLRTDRGDLPPSITLPHRIFNTDGSVWPGQDAGFLGRSQDPWLLNAQLSPAGYRIQELDLPADFDLLRLGRRKDLFDRLQHGFDPLEHDQVARRMDERSARAFDILHSPRARNAFRLDLEPESTHDQYGKTPFGQGVLLARRLVERGGRLVQVNWYRGPDEPPANPCWDSHVNEASRLKNVLLPPMDRAYAALLTDLESRGLLDETLVVCMAEFGRSPRLDSNGGRNHWGSVFSVALAGGGVRGGQAFGSSDRLGAYPREGKVGPADLAATISHCLGHSPQTEFQDALGRPFPLSRGEVIRDIF